MKKMPLLVLLGFMVTSPIVFSWSFEPKLEIRTEKIFELGKGDILFSSLDSVCEDAQKNVYVLDRMASKIYKFSPEGKFLKDLYRQGEGPGEIQSMYDFALADKKVYVLDYMKNKIIVMEEDGTFIREFKTNSVFLNDFIGIFEDWLVFSRKDSPFARKTSRLYDVNNVIVFVSKDGETEKDFFTFTNKQFYLASATGGGGMSWDPFMAVIGDGKLYACSSQEYLIEVLDLKTGLLISKFKRTYPRKKHEMRDSLKKFISKYSAPKRRFDNDIRELFYDGGNLWIQTSTEVEDKGQMYDVFDSNGRFLDSFFINTKGQIMEIEGGYIYSYETDEEDFPFLIKYETIK